MTSRDGLLAGGEGRTFVTAYVPEEFAPDEADVLRRYFTNLDGPVFALVNLPEVVKGALFARYSRSPEEPAPAVPRRVRRRPRHPGDATIDATVGLQRAEELYERVFFEYGDDSVAQLGGVHLACEQASNLLTKVLEWGRLMSYLEQSTRYIAYDSPPRGPLPLLPRPAGARLGLGTRYVGDMDRLFDTYGELLESVTEHVRATTPKDPGDSDFVYRQAIRAKALDAVRGVLPAASLSNVGIYGSGQAFEALLLRMRSHPLPEARDYAELMLHELRKVIPSFLRRVDLPDRGGAWSDYLAATRTATAATVAGLFGDDRGRARARGDARRLGSRRRGQAARGDLLPVHRPARAPGPGPGPRAGRRRARSRCCGPTSATAPNRRHKPGRAFERTDYRFDVLADYGAFRDLQRHRMLTIEWQPLTPRHGYVRPGDRRRGRAGRRLRRGDGPRSAEPVRGDRRALPGDQAPYAVSMAYRVRFAMQFNAREAMHLLELRTARPGPSGLPPGVPGDAPADRRAGRPPGHRRGHGPRRPHRARAGPAGRRAARRGPPPRSVGSVPGGVSRRDCRTGPIQATTST